MVRDRVILELTWPFLSWSPSGRASPPPPFISKSNEHLVLKSPWAIMITEELAPCISSERLNTLFLTPHVLNANRQTFLESSVQTQDRTPLKGCKFPQTSHIQAKIIALLSRKKQSREHSGCFPGPRLSISILVLPPNGRHSWALFMQ